jgi:small subunit ribosomal protein S6
MAKAWILPPHFFWTSRGKMWKTLLTFAVHLKTKPFLSMNQYETIFILTPVLSDEQVKEAVGKFEKFLNDRGTKMIHQESWGLRKLAYPIQADPTVIASFEVEFKRDERVLRFLTVRLDKHAIAFNQSRRVKKGAAEALNEGGEA